MLSIREQIGQGSFGVVYDAKHKGSHVAVKKISHIGKRHIRRNNCEVKYLLLCKHVNIMAVHCCYHTLDSDNIWLVMELLEGGSLDEAVNLSGPIPEKESCRCGSDLLAALVYLHSKGFCHRDLKPANAMLAIEQKAKRARVKLVDFSLCSDLSSGPVVHSMGTSGFMPPEMTLRQPHHYSSDIWSLGIFVATLLEGKCPNDHSRFDAHFLPAIGLPPVLSGSFSSPAHDFVAACLVVDPLARPAASDLTSHPWLQQAASMEQMWRLVKTVFRISAIANVVGN
jgi:serine/threonine protein kinase